VKGFGFSETDDLIAEVGYGKITPSQIVRKFLPKSEEESKKSDGSILNKIIGRVRKKKNHEGIVVKGLDDILVKFGKCCQPVPGDKITGYITRGQGVTIHRANCINAFKMSPERQIDVEWGGDTSDTYPVRISIRSYDRFGLLAEITASISKNGANILQAHTETKENKMVDTFFTIAVEGTDHLYRVVTSLRKIKFVQDVKRLDSN